jgi:hypothetical protein
MLPITRLYADEHGQARFADIEVSLAPDDRDPYVRHG